MYLSGDAVRGVVHTQKKRHVKNNFLFFTAPFFYILYLVSYIQEPINAESVHPLLYGCLNPMGDILKLSPSVHCHSCILRVYSLMSQAYIPDPVCRLASLECLRGLDFRCGQMPSHFQKSPFRCAQ